MISYFSNVTDKEIIDLRMANVFKKIDESVDENEITYLIATTKFFVRDHQKLINELDRLNRISNVFIEGLTKIHEGKKKKDPSYSDNSVEAILSKGEKMHLKVLAALKLLQEGKQA
ncbi:MAG: hypothetical protein H0T62_03180 [Parachlamydiaceae bacterium]|nr:hypothetical protein [Parachlamydiaceae bacterium]